MTPCDDSALYLQRVSAGWGTRLVLRDIDWTVPKGALVGVRGANGAGKTTLLRVLLGMMPLRSGKAMVCGLPLQRAHYRAIRRSTACLFQNLDADVRMPITAVDVALMGRYALLRTGQAPSASDRAEALQALRWTGVEHLADRRFGLLSGGERQRVHLARALAQQASLLLLDEPTTHLDAEARNALSGLIQRVHRERQVTVVLVSHEPEFLSRVGGEHYLMADGRLERAG